MGWDIALLVISSLIAVGFTVLGVYLATEHPVARRVFVALGVLLLVVTIAQGVRQILAQSASDDAYMNVQRQIANDKGASDQKIDSLFALLQPKVGAPPESPAASKPKHDPTSAKSSEPQHVPVLPPSGGTLTVSQVSKPSTRKDAPFATEVIVQTTQTFQSLNFALECDKPITDARVMLGNTGGMMQTTIQSGMVKDHPNVFVYSYGTSSPPFGPANPLVISVWSKESVVCTHAATF